MAGVLGRAFVQVFADLSKFSPGLKQEIQKALDENTKNIKMEELDKSAERAGESAAENVGKGLDSKIENETEKEGKKGGNSLMKGLSTGVSAAMAAFMPTMIAVGVETVAALAPAAVALGATIPAAIFTMVGSLATVKLATNGVSAALKDAFDPTKAAAFNAALKKLAPSAQSFVKEIQALHPAFHTLQQDVQQVFFNQLEGTLTRVSRQLLPTLHTGLVGLSADTGKLGNNLLAAFGNSKGDIASLFIAADAALKPFIPLVGQLVSAFLAVGAVAGPLFASLSGGFAGLLTKLVAFINTEANSGGMAQFFDDALVVIKSVGSLLGNVLGLVGSIIKALQTTGSQGLGMLSSIVGELATFFKSAAGQQTLVAVFNLLNTALTSIFQIITPLLPLVGQLATTFGGDLATALKTITPFLTSIATWLGNNPGLVEAAIVAWTAYRAALIAVSVAEGIMDALNPVGWIIIAVAAIAAGAYLIYKNWDAVVRAVQAGWAAVGSFFSGIWGWIVGVGRDIGIFFSTTMPQWFAALPGRILAALAAIPGMLWNLFLNALTLAGEAIGIGIGIILAIIIKAPGLIWDAIKGIGHLFADAWNNAFAAGKIILQAGIAAAVFLVTQLPGKIATWVDKLPGIIGGAFRTAWADAKRYVEDGANAVVGFVQRLPGRVSGFMRNVGSDILSGLKSGINAVIGGFNSGIDRVASVIHVGLPHLPMLASGGLINSPTLAVVGEAGPEAVIPMSDPATAASVAKKTGLLDMLGTSSGHSEATNVTVYLGTQQITDILDKRVDKKLNDQANELAYGTR